MPDYKIGAIKLPPETPEGPCEVIHFAILPYEGKMSRKGPEGLNEILTEITLQYQARAIEVDLAELRRWIGILLEQQAEFQRIELQMKDSAPEKAVMTDLYSGEFEEIGSPEDLAALIYSGPQF